MFKKPFIDLQSFEKEIYQKNNLLIKPLKIKDIKKRYIQSLKDKEINQYLISKKKKKLNKNHIYKYVSENNLSSSSILFGILFKDNALVELIILGCFIFIFLIFEGEEPVAIIQYEN